MTKRILALTVALLLAFCFASCKKADKDKTEVSSTDETSSYEFILEDDLDESLSPEEEKDAQNAWNSIATDSNAIVIEPYKPEGSSSKPDTSNQTVTTSTPESSSSKPSSKPPVSSSNVAPSSSSSTPASSSSSVPTTPEDKPDDTTTSSKPGWRPGIY